MWLSIIIGDKGKEGGAWANLVIPFDPSEDSIQDILNSYGGEAFVYSLTLVYDRTLLEED